MKPFWKLVIVLIVLGWAAYEMYPPTGRPLVDQFRDRAVKRDPAFNGILDRFQDLQKTRPGRDYANLLDAIGTNDVTRYFPFFDITGQTRPTTHILSRLQREASGQIKLGLDLQGGTSFLVSMNTNRLANVEQITNKVGQVQTVTNYPAADEIDLALDHAVEVLRKRVDRFGVAEPIIQRQGRNRVLIQLPGLSEVVKETARETIQKAAFLEFRLVHPDSRQFLEQGYIEPGYEPLKLTQRDNKTGQETVETILVKKRPEMTGSGIRSAWPSRDNMGQLEINFSLNSSAANRFGEITRANVGQRLAIVLDGVLYSAPVIRSPIETGSGVIQGGSGGGFDQKEAIELANVLRNPLRAPLMIEEERTVDPSLGIDSITSGVTAAAIAAVGTVLFMLVFYFASGLVANLALIMNVFILMGAMCLFDSTLTMPGIAGIALTIGMAVDANVLIYERMREEMAAGKSIHGVVAAGYRKAFGTIFDSNITTIIAAIILWWLGTGPVKGFGVTLTIGIMASMFTALFVTRMIYDFLISKGLLSRIRMLPMAKFPHLRFMNWGKISCTVSAVLILAGVGYGLFQGKKVLGVDFAGGDSRTLSFTQRVEEDQLRNALTRGGLGDAAFGYERSLATGRESLRLVAPVGAGDKALSVLRENFPQASFSVIGTDVVGATIGAEIQRSAMIASLLALFAILVYVALRYEFSFAVASVVALIHDVLITLGIYFLSGRQLTAPMTAAILTIIGYSINDKIVIMDRIREDLKLGVRGSFRDLIDLALNQTLSRTIITGGAVILATLSLLIFGGGVINDFAFAFLVGIVSGTYSSLLIASPIVLWWHKGHRPSIGVSAAGAPAAGVAPARP